MLRTSYSRNIRSDFPGLLPHLSASEPKILISSKLTNGIANIQPASPLPFPNTLGVDGSCSLPNSIP